MLRKARILCAVAGVCLLFLPMGSTDAGTDTQLKGKHVSGKVTAVTLYRGQAQITRLIEVGDGPGNVELVVENLPEQTLPESLFAESDDEIEIRAVRYRTRAVGEAPREEVRQLEQELLELAQKESLAQKRQALLKKRIEYLKKLEGFVAPTAQVELSKGVLDAETLERMTMFAFEQHEKIAEMEVELAEELRVLAKQKELLERKKAEITAGASQTKREAVVFLHKQAAGPAKIRLNYLVNNCGWSPSYTMRAAEERQQVEVEYNAIIHQLTGEDWDDVELTLSTASPSLGAAGPGLAPFFVTLSRDAPPANQTVQTADPFFDGRASKMQVRQQIQGLNKQRYDYGRQIGNSTNFNDNFRLSWSLNDFACNYNLMEMTCPSSSLGILRKNLPSETEGPSLNYPLTGKVSVACRNDQQMIRIMQAGLNSDFYHVATPVLSSFVYREAELMNNSQDDLLAGPMTVYLDGRFVGRGEIPTVARGQRFVIGFGADPQLRARRELVDRRDEVQGGNRETEFDYRLVIENFRNEPTTVRLVDRLPHSENGKQIRVTLGDTSDSLSDDKLYLREERPVGILRWEVEAAAAAAGETARLVEYSYKVEYDRNYVVSLPASKKAQQEEFERLQRNRQKF